MENIVERLLNGDRRALARMVTLIENEVPAARRYLAELQTVGLDELVGEVEPVVKEMHFALRGLEDVNLEENQDDSTPPKWARAASGSLSG